MLCPLRRMIFRSHWLKASGVVLVAGMELKCEQFWQYHLPIITSSAPALIKEVITCFSHTSPGKIPQTAHQGRSELAVVNVLGKKPCRINVISITPAVSATTAPSIRSHLGTAWPRVSDLWPLKASTGNYCKPKKYLLISKQRKMHSRACFQKVPSEILKRQGTSLFYTVPKVQPWSPPPNLPQQKAPPQPKQWLPKRWDLLDKVTDLEVPGGRAWSVPCAPSLYPRDNPCPPQGTCLCAIMISRVGELTSFQPRSVLQISSCVHRQSYVEIMGREEWERSKWGGSNPTCLFKTLLLFMPCSC